MNTEFKVPEGFRMDSKGDLRRVDGIKPIDLMRDKLVVDLAAKAKAVSEQLTELKKQLSQEIEAFIAISLEQYGTKVGGSRGNVTLLSYDGRHKIIRANQDNIVFDERLQAAKALIDECLIEWSAGAHAGLVAMVNDAFRADRNGELRSARVLSLRKHNIEDERWTRAMDAIGDALQVAGSKTYFRVYERIGQTENYRSIPLDLADVVLPLAPQETSDADQA